MFEARSFPFPLPEFFGTAPCCADRAVMSDASEQALKGTGCCPSLLSDGASDDSASVDSKFTLD